MVLNEVLAGINKKSMFVTHLNGIPFYDFIKDLNDNFDKKADEIIKGIKELVQRIINSRKDVIITVGKENKKQSLKHAKAFIEKYPCSNDTNIDIEYKKSDDNTIIYLPSMVNYVGEGASYSELGYKYCLLYTSVNTREYLNLPTFLPPDYL